MDKKNLIVLTDEPSVANNFIAELRDVNVQRDKMRFRKNLERLGEILAYRISLDLQFTEKRVQTPLEVCNQTVLAQQPVLTTILRAGIPFHQGFLNYFDSAESAFVAAYRVESTDEISVNLEYLACPDLNGKEMIIADPMLATGKSLVKTYNSLLKFGTPSKVHIAAVIGSPEGVENVRESIPNAKIWLGALDSHLNEHSYIVPGLGDAGDLSFGLKS